MAQLTAGTRIYYGGDMANCEDFGVITAVNKDITWGTSYDIKLDDGREIKRLSTAAFSEEYKGHGGTRFVTIDAYNDYRLAALTKMGCEKAFVPAT